MEVKGNMKNKNLICCCISLSLVCCSNQMVLNDNPFLKINENEIGNHVFYSSNINNCYAAINPSKDELLSYPHIEYEKDNKYRILLESDNFGKKYHCIAYFLDSNYDAIESGVDETGWSYQPIGKQYVCNLSEYSFELPNYSNEFSFVFIRYGYEIKHSHKSLYDGAYFEWYFIIYK